MLKPGAPSNCESGVRRFFSAYALCSWTQHEEGPPEKLEALALVELPEYLFRCSPPSSPLTG
jgi:hypothetical protein